MINSIRPMLMRLSLVVRNRNPMWIGQESAATVASASRHPAVGEAEADASAGYYKMPERASTTARDDWRGRAAPLISFMNSSPRRCIRGRCFLASMRMLPLRRYVMLTGPLTVSTLFMDAPLVGEVDNVAVGGARIRRRHAARRDRGRGMRVNGRGGHLDRRVGGGH